MPLPAHRFRPATPEDLPQILTLHVSALQAVGAYMSGYSEADLEDIQTSYRDNAGEFLVAVDDTEKIIAMGAFRQLAGANGIAEGIAELKRMRVQPELQGQGLGRLLLGELEQLIIAFGYEAIELDTRPDQLGAVHLYASSGYQQINKELGDLPAGVVFYRKELPQA